MNFNHIDDHVKRFYGDNVVVTDIDDRLDLFDIEKLKSIYYQLTNRQAKLIKRSQLCEEIRLIYQQWKKRQISNKSDFNLETRVICSWLIDERHSYQSTIFNPKMQLEWELFDCQDRSEYYQKCYDLLILRSQNFSQLSTEYKTTASNHTLESLFDNYFSTLYQNYQKYCSDYLRDWLLLVIVGLNLFKYHIIKLQIPHKFYYFYNYNNINTTNYELSFWKDNYLCQLVEYGSKLIHQLEVKLVYDQEQKRMGIFHLHIPIFKTLDEVLEINDGNVISGVNKDDDDKQENLLLSNEHNDVLIYPNQYLFTKKIKYRFTVNNQKNSEDEKMNEIFTRLLG